MGNEGYHNYWNYKPDVDYVTVAALGRNGRVSEGFSLKTKKLMEEKKMPLNFLFYLSFICICLTDWKLLQILFYIFEVWLMLALMLVFRPIILPFWRHIIPMLPQERHLRDLCTFYSMQISSLRNMLRSQDLLLNCNLSQCGWDSCYLKSEMPPVQPVQQVTLCSLCWWWGFTQYVKGRLRYDLSHSKVSFCKRKDGYCFQYNFL